MPPKVSAAEKRDIVSFVDQKLTTLARFIPVILIHLTTKSQVGKSINIAHTLLLALIKIGKKFPLTKKIYIRNQSGWHWIAFGFFSDQFVERERHVAYLKNNPPNDHPHKRVKLS